MSGNMVERTAKSPFRLGGMPVAAGQVVTLDALQLNQLVQAGCVARTAEENVLVPKADLPPFQVAAADTRLVEAPGATDARLLELEQSVVRAREQSATAIADVERSTTERLQAIGREVAEAERARTERLDALRSEVVEAEAARAARLDALAREVSEAEAAAGEAKKKKTGGNG